MELIDEPDLQGNNNGSSKDFGGILIEDTLRQFSRSLARLIPKTEKDLDEPTLM